MTRKLVYNAIKTPDGTVLESLHRHDYKEYVDTITKKLYMIDGGLDYIRSSTWADQEHITLFEDSPHHQKKEYLTWGAYGKDGKQPYKRIPIGKMDTDHIKAVLKTQDPSEAIRNCMLTELGCRGESVKEFLNSDSKEQKKLRFYELIEMSWR